MTNHAWGSQGFWGMLYLDDQPEEDKRAKVKPSGPAGRIDGRICEGTARMTTLYEFESGQAIAALLFLAIKAKQRLLQPGSPTMEIKRRLALILPFSGLVLDKFRQYSLDEAKDRMQLGPQIGWGAGTTVHKAWYGGRPVAVKMVDDHAHECAVERILNEISIMRSEQMRPLLGLATVDLVASGTILDTPFLAIELMRTAVREGPPLTLDQEADALKALQQLHAAGILHGDVHARNLLLPCSSSSNGRQPENLRPRWADFGASSYSRCCQEHAYELKECREMLSAHRRNSPQQVQQQKHASHPRPHRAPNLGVGCLLQGSFAARRML